MHTADDAVTLKVAAWCSAVGEAVVESLADRGVRLPGRVWVADSPLGVDAGTVGEVPQALREMVAAELPRIEGTHERNVVREERIQTGPNAGKVREVIVHRAGDPIESETEYARRIDAEATRRHAAAWVRGEAKVAVPVPAAGFRDRGTGERWAGVIALGWQDATAHRMVEAIYCAATALALPGGKNVPAGVRANIYGLAGVGKMGALVRVIEADAKATVAAIAERFGPIPRPLVRKVRVRSRAGEARGFDVGCTDARCLFGIENANRVRWTAQANRKAITGRLGVFGKAAEAIVIEPGMTLGACGALLPADPGTPAGERVACDGFLVVAATPDAALVREASAIEREGEGDEPTPGAFEADGERAVIQ